MRMKVLTEDELLRYYREMQEDDKRLLNAVVTGLLWSEETHAWVHSQLQFIVPKLEEET